MPDALRVAAIVPALDEEASLPAVIRSLREMGVDPVVVVDNGSSDGTAAVARSSGAIVVSEPRRGYGAACLAGIAHLGSLPEARPVIVFLDGDGSDDPSELPRLLAPIERDEADFVVGLRGREGDEVGAVPLHARLGNRLVRWGARLLHGARFTDLGPFRAIRRSALESLEMDDRNWGWTLQMQLRAHHLGLRTEEVPVSHQARTAGRSKVSGRLTGSVAAGLKMLLTLLTELPIAWRMRRKAGRD
jgi:glycosyltransferase involved in cell wall biosynthesis